MLLQPITSQNASQLRQVGVLGRGTPHAARYSPDGELLAVASSCGVWLYSAALENEPSLFEAESFCENLTFSPDGITLAACCTSGTVLVWDVKTGVRKATLPDCPNVLWGLAFSPDGQDLAVGGQRYEIWIWDTSTFKLKHILKHHRHSVSSVKYTPDGSLLGSRGNDGAWLYDVKTGEARKVLEEPIGDLAFSPDGEILAIGGRHLWFHNLRTDNQSLIPIEDPVHIGRLNFNPDGNLLALGCFDKTIRIWDVSSQKERNILHGHTGTVQDVAFSPDGKRLVSVGLDGSGTFGYDSSIRIWDVETGQEDVSLSDFIPHVRDIAVHPNGDLIASSHNDPFIRLWDISMSRSGVLRQVDAKEQVSSVAFSPDGETLASSHHDVTLWDIPSYRKRKVLKTNRRGAGEVDFSFDGKFLAATAWRSFARVWNLSTGEVKRIPQKPRRFSGFWHLAFCPTSALLAINLGENDIWVWNLATNERQFAFKSEFSVSHLAFSPDKKHIVTCGKDNTVNLWDITTGLQTAIFYADTHNKDKGVVRVAFNPDGKLIAFADSDKRIRLLDVERWTELADVSGHTWAATTLVFTRDSKLLISASVDGTMCLWGIPLELDSESH